LNLVGCFDDFNEILSYKESAIFKVEKAITINNKIHQMQIHDYQKYLSDKVKHVKDTSKPFLYASCRLFDKYLQNNEFKRQVARSFGSKFSFGLLSSSITINHSFSDSDSSSDSNEFKLKTEED
jgi:hypothetical protein